MNHNDETMDGILDNDGAIIQAPKSEVVEMRRQTDLAMREEVDIQVTTAKAYPRDVVRCVKDAIQMATLSAEVARSCIYALEKGGQSITGPSVRLAEMICNSWGNVRAQIKVGQEEETYVTGIGEVWDVERNVAIRREVRRSIVKRNGQRYNSDMIANATNAASSIAFREAVFKVVGKSIVDVVYNKARVAAVAGAKTPEERMAQAVKWFKKLGVSEERLLFKLGRESAAKVDDDDIEVLIGVYNRIKENETTVEEEFPTQKQTPEPTSADLWSDTMKQHREKEAAESKEPATPPPPPLTNHDRLLLLIADLAAVYKKAGTDGRKARPMAIDVFRASVTQKDSVDWTEEDFAKARSIVDEERARCATPHAQPALPGVEE